MKLLNLLLWPFLLPLLGIVWLFFPRARPFFRERLGLARARPGREPCLLLHVASLGEARAAEGLIRKLSSRLPLILTTMTATGRNALASAHPDIPVSLAPLDLPGLWAPFLSSRRVRAILLFETEIWPAMLLSARENKIPVGIVNGRLSSRSFARYRRLSFLVRGLFADLSPVLVSGESDRERFLALGVKETALAVTGNLKWDLTPSGVSSPAAEKEILRWLGREATLPSATPPSPSPKDPPPLILVGSSVHPEEALAIVDACLLARAAGTTIHPVLALRHLETLPDVLSRLPASVCPVLRTRTEKNAGGSPGGEIHSGAESGAGPAPGLPVFLLDTYGELGRLLGEADLVFVGGTLDPVGGHSPVEAAFHGKPLLLGPHQDHIALLVAPLREEGAIREIADRKELLGALSELSSDRERRILMGEAARRVFERLGGPLDRTMEKLAPLLGRFPGGG